MNTTATPGYNTRLAIWFTTTKTGKRRAYYFSTRALRSFPIGADKADLLIATGQADRIAAHPFPVTR